MRGSTFITAILFCVLLASTASSLATSNFQSTATKTIPGSIRSHKRVVRAALHCASRSCVLIALASPEPQ